MVDFLIAPILVFLLFGGWVLVQFIARAFAARHPELGPYREEGGGHCHCGEQRGCDSPTRVSIDTIS
jgi:hypothetical protein